MSAGPCEFDYCQFVDDASVGSCQNIGAADFMCDCSLPRVWDPAGHKCHGVIASVAARNLMCDYWTIRLADKLYLPLLIVCLTFVIAMQLIHVDD